MSWLEEKENLGCIKGYNELFWQSKGKYIFILNDKWKITNKILKSIQFLESDIFKNRKFKITTINVHHTFNYGITDMPILNGSQLLQQYLPIELLNNRFLKPEYRYPIFGFPVCERESIKKYMSNHIFNPKFKNHFADNWISFYIGEQGEFPLVCEDSYMEIFGGPGIDKDDAADFNTFCELAKNLINKVNLNYV